jgi:hypothetical protein
MSESSYTRLEVFRVLAEHISYSHTADLVSELIADTLRISEAILADRTCLGPAYDCPTCAGPCVDESDPPSDAPSPVVSDPPPLADPNSG